LPFSCTEALVKTKFVKLHTGTLEMLTETVLKN